MTFADELLAIAAEKKLTLSPNVERFVKAWGQMEKAVRMPASQPSDVEDWKLKLDAATVRVDGHYAILSWDTPERTVSRRAMQTQR